MASENPLQLVSFEDFERGLVSNQYGQGPENVNARWKIYERAVPHDNQLDHIWQMATEAGVGYNSTLLDVGCSDGSNLIQLCEKVGHYGKKYGIDPFLNPDSERLRPYVESGRIIPIVNYVENDSTIPGASIDVALVMSMLYHTRYPAIALRQLQTWLRPEGIALFSTTGKNNKPRQREFQQDIAGFLHVRPPPNFNERFNDTNAIDVLSPYFDVFEHYPDPFDLRYAYASYDLSNCGEFIGSLLSMESAFRPRPSHEEFLWAVEKVVLPQIAAAIARNGCFIETVDRHYYACRKKTA